LNETGLNEKIATESKAAGFPRLGWLGALWLLVYVPVYQSAYGTLNFLFLCNIGVILTAIGLILRSRLLISSQGVAAPVIALAWALDAVWKLVSGDFLFGGTSYMWDPAFPLAARLLSLYHLAWPVLLWAVLRRTGYDPRGWPLQAAIAALALIAGRLLAPAADNINFAWTDPFFARQLGPAALQLRSERGLGLGVAGHALQHHAGVDEGDAHRRRGGLLGPGGDARARERRQRQGSDDAANCTPHLQTLLTVVRRLTRGVRIRRSCRAGNAASNPDWAAPAGPPGRGRSPGRGPAAPGGR